MRPVLGVIAIALAACGSSSIPPLATAEPGVVFTYPSNAQLDVPLGTRIVVAFSEPVSASALGPCSAQGDGGLCLVGPSGAVDAMADVTPDGDAVEIVAPPLEAGTTYRVFVSSAIDPAAQNLPASGPLLSFTTRSELPRAGAPTLVAINGAAPSSPEAFRPMLDSSTIRLVFSEPLDPRSVALAPGAIELVDGSGSEVPASVIASGIHVSIDPVADLTGGATYQLKLGSSLLDLGGEALAPIAIPLVPHDTHGANGRIAQVLRTRTASDPAVPSRTGAAPNAAVIQHPLIGTVTSNVQPGALATELGDPTALPDLGNPIAFSIPRGQRLTLSGFDIALGGTIPAGVSTGNIEIELLTDAGGRMYRNPNQPVGQRPENLRAPLYVDLSMDVAIYAIDPTGNAVLSQTVLGVQASGVVTIDNGALQIESMSSLELGVLGVTSAPSNLVLSLLTDLSATPDADTTPPTLVASYPASGSSLSVDQGIELIFSEPVDLDKLRAGGLALHDGAGTQVPFALESAGATVVVRPLSYLSYGTSYFVELDDVEDLAGNKLTGATPVNVLTPALASTSVPLGVAAVYPGVPCALTGATTMSPGRCSGGQSGDDLYHPFALPADQAIEVQFTQTPSRASITPGTACNTGSFRVEQVDGSGACVAPVPGTFEVFDRSVRFVPDQPWTAGASYKFSVVSGSNNACNTGELCGPNGDAASFDPLSGDSGNGDSGGPDLVLPFVGAASNGSTFMFMQAAPFSDINGDGALDGSEQPADQNRAALRITGTTGAIGDASFNEPDCDPSTPETEACIYLGGGMPVQVGELQMNCALPDGSTAPSCMPLTLSPQVMYGTTISMSATVGVSITTDTKTTVIRIREPASGPITGYLIDGGNGKPKLVLALDLYMDAPDMSIPLSSDDLHSKAVSVLLEGPLQVLPDGRLAIQASNVADVPLVVNIDGPLGISGSVQMVLAAGEMKLQLMTPPLRGAPR